MIYYTITIKLIGKIYNIGMEYARLSKKIYEWNMHGKWQWWS
jgi:hypothetical protein